MLTKIEVTQEDIRSGQRCDCTRCPLAVAVARKAPGAKQVSVSNGMAWFFARNPDEHSPVAELLSQAALPGEGRLFYVQFDQGKIVAPFSFDLDIPEEFLETNPC